MLIRKVSYGMFGVKMLARAWRAISVVRFMEITEKMPKIVAKHAGQIALEEHRFSKFYLEL